MVAEHRRDEECRLIGQGGCDRRKASAGSCSATTATILSDRKMGRGPCALYDRAGLVSPRIDKSLSAEKRCARSRVRGRLDLMQTRANMGSAIQNGMHCYTLRKRKGSSLCKKPGARTELVGAARRQRADGDDGENPGKGERGRHGTSCGKKFHALEEEPSTPHGSMRRRFGSFPPSFARRTREETEKTARCLDILKLYSAFRGAENVRHLSAVQNGGGEIEPDAENTRNF